MRARSVSESYGNNRDVIKTVSAILKTIDNAVLELELRRAIQQAILKTTTGHAFHTPVSLVKGKKFLTKKLERALRVSIKSEVQQALGRHHA